MVNKQNKQGMSKSDFQIFLEKHGIKHIVARVDHPRPMARYRDGSAKGTQVV